MAQKSQRKNTVLIVAIIGLVGGIIPAIITGIVNYNIEKLRQETEFTKTALESITMPGIVTKASLVNTISAPTETPALAPSPPNTIVTSTPLDTPPNMQTLVPTSTNTPTPTPFYCTKNGSGGTETIKIVPPRTISGVYIDLKERATKFGFSLYEVKIYPDSGVTNLAIGATPTASSSQDSVGCEGCSPIKAIDNDMNTRWSSDWRDEQSFKITLSMPYIVSRIELRWEAAYAKKYCVILIE
jgi:hypothetical protein